MDNLVLLLCLVVLCLMKGKKTVEGMCGCMTGTNFDVPITAGSDLNCQGMSINLSFYYSFFLISFYNKRCHESKN